MSRKPTQSPIKRPSTSAYKKPQPRASLPWGWVIGIARILLIATATGLFLRNRSVAQTPPTTTQVTAQTNSVATSVAATVQALSSNPANSQTTASSQTTPVNATVPPSTTIPATFPDIETAVTVNIQRDENVDPITGMTTWTEPASRGEISIRLRLADSTPVDAYISIHQQTADVSGNPAYGDKIEGGWSGDDGILTKPIPPDIYILDFDANGWPWSAQFTNHTILNGQRTNILFDYSLLTVGIRYADGQPADKYITVYLQESNVSGQAVEGRQASGGWCGDDGLITFPLTPGVYALAISNIDGYGIEDRFNHQLPGGGLYHATITLGRLVVETWNPDGSLAPNTYTQIFSLTQDAAGNTILGQRLANGRSDNTGQAIFNLTPGLYGIAYGDNIEFIDVPVQPGQTTIIHQTGYNIP